MPESIGKILKRIRESKRFSLEEVSERSRISKNIVIAIEEDRLSEIKSGFYAKSFIKTYAAFLGALNESGVKEYLAAGRPVTNTKTINNLSLRGSDSDRSNPTESLRGRSPKQSHQIASPPARNDINCVRTKTNSREIPPSSKVPRIDFSAAAKYKKQALAVVIGISIFCALSLAIGQAGKFIKNTPVKKQSKAVVVKKEASKTKKPEREKPKDTAKGAKKDPFIKKSDAIELEVSASDNTWLQVMVDGEIAWTGSFKKGGKDTWKAKKEIKLEAGNSGAVKININGKPAGFSGKKGEKKEIVITKDGIK